MAVTESAGATRARSLLNGVPNRFNDFCHMDQITFVQLADWILENTDSMTMTSSETPSAEAMDISIEESLFVFLDIVAQGSSFKATAYEWDHDVKLCQSIFLNILNSLQTLREKEEISPSCPSVSSSKSRWRVIKGWRPGRSRMDGLVKIGDSGGDGLEVNQEQLTEAINALNNFIHERRDC